MNYVLDKIQHCKMMVKVAYIRHEKELSTDKIKH